MEFWKKRERERGFLLKFYGGGDYFGPVAGEDDRTKIAGAANKSH